MNSAVLSLLIAVAVHHSIAGVYDNSRQVTIEGVIAEFHFVNPHPFVIVDVNSERWKLEMDNLYLTPGVYLVKMSDGSVTGYTKVVVQ